MDVILVSIIHLLQGFLELLLLLGAEDRTDRLVGIGPDLFILGAELDREGVVPFAALLEYDPELLFLGGIQHKRLCHLFDDFVPVRQSLSLRAGRSEMSLIDIVRHTSRYASQQKDCDQHESCACLGSHDVRSPVCLLLGRDEAWAGRLLRQRMKHALVCNLFRYHHTAAAVRRHEDAVISLV